MAGTIFTVGQVNSYIKNLFEQDFLLKRISMRGEVSNCKYHSSGHLYFSLKDESGTISCVMFAGNRRGLSFHMEEGHKVIVSGSISVYERDGSYQMYARKIELDGIGQLYLRFEKLKRELEEMGMFAEEYKQRIPVFAQKIGIVTAPTGAAIRDIIQVSQRRNPYVQLILYPALVQGEGAAESIVCGIEMLDQMNLDVLIIGRGGGSIEDLWAFNEECVARAVFNCTTPIISAVGHQTDTTIVDYVADLRAPTPSAAAELAVYEQQQLYQQMEACRQQLLMNLQQRIDLLQNRMEQLQLRLQHSSPQQKLKQQQQRLQQYHHQIQQVIQQKLKWYEHQIQILAARLDGLSPLKKMSSGYSYTATASGKALTSITQVQTGEKITVHVADGQVRAEVKEITEIFREVKTDVEGNQVFTEERE